VIKSIDLLFARLGFFHSFLKGLDVGGKRFYRLHGVVGREDSCGRLMGDGTRFASARAVNSLVLPTAVIAYRCGRGIGGADGGGVESSTVNPAVTCATVVITRRAASGA